MVSVKIDFKKRDLMWAVPVILVLGVGFAFAFGGSTPDVMGHSGGELLVKDSDGVDVTLQELIDQGGLVGPTGATGARGVAGTDGSAASLRCAYSDLDGRCSSGYVKTSNTWGYGDGDWRAVCCRIV